MEIIIYFKKLFYKYKYVNIECRHEETLQSHGPDILVDSFLTFQFPFDLHIL